MLPPQTSNALYYLKVDGKLGLKMERKELEVQQGRPSRVGAEEAKIA